MATSLKEIKMITVHHLEDSRSQRILWLLESLGLEYEVVRYERDKKTSLAPKELLKVHPLGKSPVITDDGMTLAESGAIFEYLLQKYDNKNQLRPSSTSAKFPNYLFWLHFAEGSLMWPLVIRLLHQKVIEKAPFPISSAAKLIFLGIEKAYLSQTIKQALDYAELSLQKNKFFLGDEISAADIMMSFPLQAACSGRSNMENYPKIKNFVAEIKKDPNYIKAIEVGGEFSY